MKMPSFVQGGTKDYRQRPPGFQGTGEHIPEGKELTDLTSSVRRGRPRFGFGGGTDRAGGRQFAPGLSDAIGQWDYGTNIEGGALREFLNRTGYGDAVAGGFAAPGQPWYLK